MGGAVVGCAGYDDSIRWRPGQRLERLFERQADELGDRPALDTGDQTLSYRDLDARANQLARFLIRDGLRPGDRVALLSDQPVDGYVGMLAVLKAHAAYVPLDNGFPKDRIDYIIEDAGVSMVLTRAFLEENQQAIAREAPTRPDSVPRPPDELCYVIYTSGTTGRPKGVAVSHPSICNFVQVAAQVYGIETGDRVYQGMTLAFDFSVEEIWVPWMSGATLVPKPPGHNLLGKELADFIDNSKITAMCCVPTVLATLEDDLPELRFLLVSGESCPQDLIIRWHRPGRRFLNVYGPTEATVTATWTVLHPDRPVTIGVPLPTYWTVILDPETAQVLPPGAMGEIGIAGIGLADGYLNRPDLTDRAFIPDFIGIPGNPSRRIYRTGDLGRITDTGEIEHHGRIDTQVKIRGYRIELAEIESVLLGIPGIAQAVVAAFQPDPATTELVAYYSLRSDAPDADPAALYQELRNRLPAYMVPSHLERLPSIPLLPSGKADRKNLPAPSGQRLLAGRGAHVQPEGTIETTLADLLASVLSVDRVSADSDFFTDLGANSLLMARFTAAVRERTSLGRVSVKDVYQHPTIRLLAAELARTEPVARVPAQRRAPAERQVPARGTPRYLLCGLLQGLFAVGYVMAAALLLRAGFGWVTESRSAAQIYARLVAFGGGGLLAVGTMPIVVKWVVIGRWTPDRVRVWSLPYLRFWIVKTLLVANPLARQFVGTPLYNFYLRALGAKIGKGTVIFGQQLPVSTDLLSVGAGTVIRKDTFLAGYRAWDGAIETGTVTIGADVFIGERSVLDIGTGMGDGAQLGHASALYPGQAVPSGQCWHGSPARQAPPDYDYATVPPVDRGAIRRRLLFCVTRVLLLVLVAGPIEAGTVGLLVTHPGVLTRLLPSVSSPGYYEDVAGLAAIAMFGLIVVGLAVTVTAPRLLGRLLRPGRVYPLFGFRHLTQRAVSRISNDSFFTALFGDSSAITRYLGYIGYRLKPVEQTGSNFGMAVKHEVPGLSVIGTGTMVSDGLSLVNAEFSATSFRVAPVVIGRRNFLGNRLVYPVDGRTGDNCLLATKAMIPVAGPVREGVGLLGSPCFEIPRSVARDTQFAGFSDPGRRRGLLRAKNRHNAVTMALYLLVRLVYLTALLLLAMAPARGGIVTGTLASAATLLLILVFTTVYFVLVDRAVNGFRRLHPQLCSIYQRTFWQHERFWKVPSSGFVQIFNGTPLKPLIWRLLGARMGRRVFDDGCGLVERSLVEVGDDCTLAVGSLLQCHSLEDGVFKSDRITIGAGCTIGTSAFVHYGTVMGDGAMLATDSFLMKGESVPPGARWGGNPATGTS
jgi:non-ribosomal peptide synthetase-like protein